MHSSEPTADLCGSAKRVSKVRYSGNQTTGSKRGADDTSCSNERSLCGGSSFKPRQHISSGHDAKCTSGKPSGTRPSAGACQLPVADRVCLCLPAFLLLWYLLGKYCLFIFLQTHARNVNCLMCLGVTQFHDHDHALNLSFALTDLCRKCIY